jgi:hypothetical protein
MERIAILTRKMGIRTTAIVVETRSTEKVSG